MYCSRWEDSGAGFSALAAMAAPWGALEMKPGPVKHVAQQQGACLEHARPWYYKKEDKSVLGLAALILPAPGPAPHSQAYQTQLGKEEQAYLISSRSACFPWCLTPGPDWLLQSSKQPWHPMDVVQAGEGLSRGGFCPLQKLTRRSGCQVQGSKGA